MQLEVISVSWLSPVCLPKLLPCRCLILAAPMKGNGLPVITAPSEKALKHPFPRPSGGCPPLPAFLPMCLFASWLCLSFPETGTFEARRRAPPHSPHVPVLRSLRGAQTNELCKFTFCFFGREARSIVFYLSTLF